ncbi:hypothetical protein HDE_03533 [Halotydeus destructor]|nr:hypothetical protein HDE_03533 [Halotydeus destructor]
MPRETRNERKAREQAEKLQAQRKKENEKAEKERKKKEKEEKRRADVDRARREAATVINYAQLFRTIDQLERKGYNVEYNFGSKEYAIFVGEPSLATHVGYIHQGSPDLYAHLTCLDLPELGVPFELIETLPDLTQEGAVLPPFRAAVPGSNFTEFGQRTVVVHPFLNSFNFHVVDFAAGLQKYYFVYYKAGQLFGLIQKSGLQPAIYPKPNAFPLIIFDELRIVYNPRDVEDRVRLRTPGHHHFVAHYLPRMDMSAVWQYLSHGPRPRRIKFVGFVNGTTEAINIETDYYWSLDEPDKPKAPIYPIGVSFFPYRCFQKPVKPVKQPADQMKPQAMMEYLDAQGVEYWHKWFEDDGLFGLYDSLEGLGGLVYAENTEYFFRWDGVKNFLVTAVTVAEVVKSYKMAKAKANKAERAKKRLVPGHAEPDSESDDDTQNLDDATEPIAPKRRFVEIKDAFGKDTFFVKDIDGEANLGDPLTWPWTRRQDITEREYWLNAFGNLEVKHFKNRMVESGRFYNKEHQRNCYSYSVSDVSGNLSIPKEGIIWEYDSDKTRQGALTRFGYDPQELDNSTGCVVDHVDVSKTNGRKFITKQGGKSYYLSVVRATSNDIATTLENTAASACHLVAIGAANRTLIREYITTQIEKQSNKVARLVIVKGTKLEEILSSASSECLSVDRLARTAESYDTCKMWNLTRNVTGSSRSSLPMWDIGVRVRDRQDSRFVETKNRQGLKLFFQASLVRCFVALVPDDQDGEGCSQMDINVVSVQDVHPVNGEMHIVYLLHHRGEFYTQRIYGSVLLVHVKMSETFLNHFMQLYQKQKITVVQPKPIPKPTIKVRGYYNEFWKNVCHPTRKKMDADQVELYTRWQHFYQHDFLGVNYLASPLSTFRPGEIHIVNVVRLLKANSYSCFIGDSENKGERVFLSGAYDSSQSYTGAPFVVYKNFIVQVEVPDENEIKCVIYDFQGLNEYLADDTEGKAKAMFEAMANLTKASDSNIPQRLFFSRVVVNGRPRNYDFKSSQEQEDGKHNILVPCPEDLENHALGCIYLNLFYFVSHVGIDHIKVGVANVPFNCRSYVTHHDSFCKNVVERNYGSSGNNFCQDFRFPDKKTATILRTQSNKYPVRGCLWREGDDQIVGIVDGRQAPQYLAQASLFKTVATTSTKVAIMTNYEYSDKNVVIQPALDKSQGFNANDRVTVYINTPATDRRLEMTHFVRQVSNPIFDITKGYPVHGFYKLDTQDTGAIYDDVFDKLVNNFEAFSDPNKRSNIPTQVGELDGGSRARNDFGTGSPSSSSGHTDGLCSLAAILSASSALYLVL